MKKLNILTIALLAVGLSACKKDFLSLEQNPNNPSVTTPQFTLTGAEKTAADLENVGGGGAWDAFATWDGQYAPSGNYVPSAGLQQYQFTNTSYQPFVAIYQNATNFNNLIKMSSTADLANFQAIGMIMKAFDMQMAVDVYNDVPYSQAFQAPNVLFPVYDKGADIYADLVKQLDAAIALINKSGSATSPGSADIIFSGDMTKWKKFANTIKLRLAIRLSNLTTNPAQADLASTSTEGYLTFTAAAQPGYLNNDSYGGQESPFWRVYGFNQSGNPIGGSNDYWRANNFEITMLQNFTDPRLGQLWTKASTGSYVGIVFGSSTAIPNTGTSGLGPGLLQSYAQPGTIFSAAQSLFLQAEAAQRGWISGDAKTFYQQAITASFEALGLSDAQASAYYSQNLKNVGWDASTTSSITGADPKVEAIITQKYIALTGYERVEAWFDVKRTNFPYGNTRSIDSKAIGTGIPYRVYYPSTEYAQNGTNVAKEGTIDPFNSKVFWEATQIVY